MSSSRLVVLLAVVACACLILSGHALADKTYNLNGRTYTIANPTVSGSKLPLVLFHNGLNCGCGSGANLVQAAQKIGLTVLGGSVCAIKSSWDIGGSKDLDYTDAVIADIKTKFSIDPNKIFLTGFSMGGMHVSRYACQRGNKVLAVSPSACALDCTNPVGKTHWLGMEGTSDTVCPKWVDKAYAKLTKALGCSKTNNVNSNTDVIQMCGGKRVDLRHYPAGHSFLRPDVQMQLLKSILSGVEVVKAGSNDTDSEYAQYEDMTAVVLGGSNGGSSEDNITTPLVISGVCVLVAVVAGAALIVRVRRQRQKQLQAANTQQRLEHNAAAVNTATVA